MFVYVEIVHIYFLQIQYSLLMQGEACKDKIDASKTPVLFIAESEQI